MDELFEIFKIQNECKYTLNYSYVWPRVTTQDQYQGVCTCVQHGNPKYQLMYSMHAPLVSLVQNSDSLLDGKTFFFSLKRWIS